MVTVQVWRGTEGTYHIRYLFAKGNFSKKCAQLASLLTVFHLGTAWEQSANSCRSTLERVRTVLVIDQLSDELLAFGSSVYKLTSSGISPTANGFRVIPLPGLG
jgi:hypothetical protein